MNIIQQIESMKYQYVKINGRHATKLYISYEKWDDELVPELRPYLLYQSFERVHQDVPKLFGLDVYFVGNDPTHLSIV